MRNFYVMPREITQGSIINNCLADCYPEAHVDGIIITPRCDLAHDAKVNFIHYLPIISFKEWLLNDGKEYLFAKWFAVYFQRLFATSCSFLIKLSSSWEKE